MGFKGAPCKRCSLAASLAIFPLVVSRFDPRSRFRFWDRRKKPRSGFAKRCVRDGVCVTASLIVLRVKVSGDPEAEFSVEHPPLRVHRLW